MDAVTLSADVALSEDVTVTGLEFADLGEYKIHLASVDAKLTVDKEITDHVDTAVDCTELSVTGTYVYALTPLAPEVKAPTQGTSATVKGGAVNEESHEIILDVLDPISLTDKSASGRGITVEALLAYLNFEAENATLITSRVLVNGNELAAGALVPTGATVEVTASNPVSDETATVTYTVVILGDINCNGMVDSGDAVLMMRHYFQIITLTGARLSAADTNRNGEVDAGDAVKNSVKYVRPESYKTALH